MRPYEIIREQMERYESGGNRLSRPERRLPVIRDSINLIIGLGGSGCRALIETKELIEQMCKDPGDRVAYLAIDSDEASLNWIVANRLKPREKILLRPEEVAGMFWKGKISQTRTTCSEVFEWADIGILNQNVYGVPAGVRQIGRMLLLKNEKCIEEVIGKALHDMAVDVGRLSDNIFVNIYVLAGVCGGTGGGMFIDIPYIVRNAISRIPFLSRRNHEIYGYLMLPDVTQYGNEVMMNRNAYAALQELDYCMTWPELEEEHTRAYPNGRLYDYSCSRTRIYDSVHLISGKSPDDSAEADTEANMMKTIARNILSFVADETLDDSPFTQLRMASWYSDVESYRQMNRIENPSFRHCFSDYRAIGSVSCELPVDDMILYTASLLFGRMETLFARKTNVKEGVCFASEIGLDSRTIVDVFKIATPQLAVCTTDREAFKKGRLTDYLGQAQAAYGACMSPGMRDELAETAKKIAGDICDRFDYHMRHLFVDRMYGPNYAEDMISYGVAVRLEEQLRELPRLAGEMWRQLTEHHIPVYTGVKRKAESIIGRLAMNCDEYNAAGLEVYNSYLYCALEEYMKMVYGYVYDHVMDWERRVFGLVRNTLSGLKDALYEKAEQFREQADHQEMLNWNDLKGSMFIGLVEDRFKAVFDKKTDDHEAGTQLIDQFLMDLWNEAMIWRVDSDAYDPLGFVRRFIADHFGCIANMSFEEAITGLCKTRGTDLESYIIGEMIPGIIRDAAPMICARSGMPMKGCGIIISVPAQCRQIIDILSERGCQYLKDRMDSGSYWINRSVINTRILVQTCQPGLTLAHYEEVWKAEGDYAVCREDAGVHLIAPRGEYAPPDSVNWNNLCTLIPFCMRPEKGISPAVRQLVDEEAGRKERLRNCIEQINHIGSHPCVELRKEEGRLGIELTVTDVCVEFREGILTFGSDRAELSQLEKYDFSEREQALAAWDRIAVIFEKGFVEALGECAVTANKYKIREEIGMSDDETVLESLLELYSRRIILVHKFEKELAKLETLREALRQIDAKV